MRGSPGTLPAVADEGGLPVGVRTLANLAIDYLIQPKPGTGVGR